MANDSNKPNSPGRRNTKVVADPQGATVDHVPVADQATPVGAAADPQGATVDHVPVADQATPIDVADGQQPPTADHVPASDQAAPKDVAVAPMGQEWLNDRQARELLAGHAELVEIGPYRVLGRLGGGAMGQVFKARHRQLGRLVALKVIHPNRLENPQTVARFQQEARTAAQLAHPHVIVVYEAGVANGLNYLAMEYMDGVDLQAIVRRDGALPIPLACEYARQAAMGLEHAHQRGLIHRDIKPSNMLLAAPSPNERPIVKVLDFGLARFAGEASDAGLTGEGQMMGTPDYIAPEQAEDAHRADIRSDIFSLGCTLHFLLSGKVPFDGATVVEKLVARLKGQPRSIRADRPDVSPALEAVLHRALARDPAERYQSPIAFAKALEAAAAAPDDEEELYDRVTVAAPGSAPRRAAARRRPRPAPTSKRKKLLLGAGLLAILLALGSIWLASRSSSKPVVAKNPVVDQEANNPSPGLPKVEPKPIARPVDTKGPPAGPLPPPNPNPIAKDDPDNTLEVVQTIGHVPGHLWNRGHRVALRGDGQVVATLAQLPTGPTAYQIVLWNAQLKELSQFPVQNQFIHCLAFTPDGRGLLVASAVGLSMWDVSDPEAPSRCWEQTGKGYAAIQRLQFVNERTVAGISTQALTVFTLNGLQFDKLDRQVERTFLMPAAITRDGKQVIFPDARARSVGAYDLDKAAARDLFPFQDGASHPMALAVSPAGDKVAVSHFKGNLKLWDISTDKPKLAGSYGTGESIPAIAFTPDGRQLVIGDELGQVRLLALADGTLEPDRVLCKHAARVADLASTPDFAAIATLADDQMLRLTANLKAGGAAQGPDENSTKTEGCAFTSDGKRLVTVHPVLLTDPALDASASKAICWDLATNKVLKTMSGLRSQIGVAADGEEKRVGVLAPPPKESLAGDATALRLWNLDDYSTTELTHSLNLVGSARMHRFQFDQPTGGRLAVMSCYARLPLGGVYNLIDLQDGKYLMGLAFEKTNAGGCMAVSRDGKLLALFERTPTQAFLRIYKTEPWLGRLFGKAADAKLPPAEAELTSDSGSNIFAMAFAPDDDQLIVTGFTVGISSWAWKTDKSLQSLDKLAKLSIGGTRSDTRIAFAPNGKRFAVATCAGEVLLWDLSTKKRLGFRRFPGAINDVAFSPDGKRLATANGDGTSTILKVPE